MLFLCALILGVLVHSTLQQPLGVTLLQDGRPGNMNTLIFTCNVISQLQHNERIYFTLNSTRVEDFTGLGRERTTTTSIEVTIDHTLEGFFRCEVSDIESGRVIEISAPLGPYTVIPGIDNDESVRLFYVGFVGSDVTLLPVVPLGVMDSLYTYIWTNSTSSDVSGMEGFHPKHNGSLSITSLTARHNGSYSLTVMVGQVGSAVPYTNNSYQLQVQETPQFHAVTPPSIVRLVHEQPVEPIVISCSAQAYPNVRLTWTHNNRVISTDEKYQITQDPSDEVTTANSTLTIRDISSSDNGVVSCVAETDGCDVTLSKNSCHRIVLTNRTDTTLNIYTRDFQFNVTVVNGKNLELRLRVRGRPIPEAVHVYLKYLDEDTDNRTVYVSPTSYPNRSEIPLFIPTTVIPTFPSFKIQVALGNDQSVGPYKSPIRDEIYKIDVCNNEVVELALSIAIPTAVAVVLITSIVAFAVWEINKRNNKTKLAQEAEKPAQEAEMTRIHIIKYAPDLSSKEKLAILEEQFPTITSTIRTDGGEDISESESRDSYTSSNEIKPDPTSRVEPDNSRESETDNEKLLDSPRESSQPQKPRMRVSKEWMEETDIIFSQICDKKKKRDVMFQLLSVMSSEKLIPVEITI